MWWGSKPWRWRRRSAIAPSRWLRPTAWRRRTLPSATVSQAAGLLRQNVEALEAGVPDPRMLYGFMSRAWLALVLGVRGDFAQGRPYGEEAVSLTVGGESRQ